ncbi:hypothetical protein IKD57_01395 [Candidatus Saccharibacteria bacterium]|nr:hypothetical protein [Candidatus Saccharibacteria bacterium]
MGRTPKYKTEEERKAAKAAREKAWRAAHPDRVKQYEQNRKKPKPSPEEKAEAQRIAKERRAAYVKKWHEEHKEERRTYMREYARLHRQARTNAPE